MLLSCLFLKLIYYYKQKKKNHKAFEHSDHLGFTTGIQAFVSALSQANQRHK